MAWYPYSYKTAFDPTSGERAPAGASGQIYAIGDTTFANPLQAYDLAGLAVDLVVQGDIGYIPTFQVEDQTSVVWKSGDYVFEFTTTMPLPGPTGAKITNAADNGDGTMTFTLSDGSTVGPVTIPEGPQGEQGPPGFNATGAVEDQQTLADYVNETAGANPFSGALSATFGFISGVVGDDLTDNSAVIQAALDQGGEWMLPATSGRYAVASSIQVSVPGTKLTAHGATIHATHQMPVFEIIAPDVTLDVPHIVGTDGSPDVGAISGTWQGSSMDSAWCAVNVGDTAHRLRIPYLKGEGMSTVVRIGGWNYATSTNTDTLVEDVEIGTLLCDRVEFAFAGRNTLRMKLGSVRGRYGNVTGASRAGHLVYFADGFSPAGGSYQLYHSDGAANGGKGGTAFQYKGVHGGQIGTLQAEDCDGILNVMECSDTEFGNILSMSDTFTGTAGSVGLSAATSNDGLVFGNIKLHMASDAPAFRVTHANNSTFGHIHVITAHATAGGNDVELAGENNTIEKVTVDNTGGVESWTALEVFSGSGHRVGDIVATNVRIGVSTRETDVRVSYSQDNITLHPNGLYKASAASNASAVSAVWREPANQFLLGHPRMASADDFSLLWGSGGYLGGTISGHVWKWTSGSWFVDGGTRRAYENTGVADRLCVHASTPDGDIECGILWQTGEGLVFRLIDGNNHLVVIPTSTGTILRKVDAGVPTTLVSATRTHTPGHHYVVRVKVQGDNIRVYEDAEPVLEHTLTAADQTKFGAANQHGMRSSSSAGRFDSFRVLSL